MNSDFQRLLDDMDRALRRKQQELSELDERLETARKELSEKEAKELLSNRESDLDDDRIKQQDFGAVLQEQRDHYEAKLSNLTEELFEAENSNQNLVQINGQLRFEIDSLRVSNEKLRNRAQTLNDNLDEVQSANFELNIRLAKAESQAQMQQNLLIKSHEQDQILMSAFNSKLESLKDAISRRDDEIKRLRELNEQLTQSTGTQRNEASPADPTDDSKYSEPREDSTSLRIGTRGKVEQPDKQSTLVSRGGGHSSSTAVESANDKNNHNSSDDSRQEIRDLEMRNNMLEVELDQKDKLLHSTDKRIHYFESIFPNMIVDLIENLTGKLSSADNPKKGTDDPSATNQIDPPTLSLISNLRESLDKLLDVFKSNQMLLNMVDQLQATILTKDRNIERLVRELNTIDAGIDSDQRDSAQVDENVEANSTQLTPAAGGPPNRVLDGIVKDKFTVLGHDSRDPDATAELLSKETPSNEQSQPQSETPVFESDQQSASVIEESAPTLNQTDPRVDDSEEATPREFKVKEQFSPEFERSAVSEENTAGRADDSLSETKQAISYLNPMQKDRLQQLEEENQMLELAMKEILLSIKWSDTKCSTILIDCPSLERLCQLIEARYLANIRNLNPEAPEDISATPNCDLFQFVVMKSELDILRGQNEQLRTDLKLIRRDNQLGFTPPDPPNQIFFRSSTPRQDADDNEYGRCEIECQTDSLILINPENFSSMYERFQSQEVIDDKNPPVDKKKCQNCTRLVRLANHLLDCIVRIEDRVNSSDESFISRLMTLYQLIQRLSKELSSKDSAINQLRREYHNLSQKRSLTEARYRAIENSFEIHSRVCPLNYTSPNKSNKLLKAANSENPNEMVPSLTIRTNQDQVEVPLQDGRITISLLQSIIGCLQARLDYKDERLAQLERMLVSS